VSVGEQNGDWSEMVLSQNLGQLPTTALARVHNHAFATGRRREHKTVSAPWTRREPGDEHNILHQVVREP